ncbi:MAG TPA: DUF177 domain-containing protein [bacterium]|nr:DUF177 domain-containing protein [bacterium]HPS28672.1 DUF177 domain-containing protein [bacterium]
MKLYLSEITDSIVKRRVEFIYENEEFNYGSKLKGLELDVSSYRAGETVCLKFEGNFTIGTLCDRCAADLEVCTDVSESYYLFPERSSNDVDYFYSGDSIELDDFVRETVIINIPGKILCSDDCQGLCPRCGVNLNDKKCGCTFGNDETV